MLRYMLAILMLFCSCTPQQPNPNYTITKKVQADFEIIKFFVPQITYKPANTLADEYVDINFRLQWDKPVIDKVIIRIYYLNSSNTIPRIFINPAYDNGIETIIFDSGELFIPKNIRVIEDTFVFQYPGKYRAEVIISNKYHIKRKTIWFKIVNF